MKFALVALFGFTLAAADRREQLQREDLRSVQHWFRQKDSRLSQFFIADKQPIDATYSVLTATGSAVADKPEDRAYYFGVVVVYGKTNQVYMVIDIRRDETGCCIPQLEPPTADSVHIHLIADYGMYRGSYKYDYDLHQRRPATRYFYQRFSVSGSSQAGGELRFTGYYDRSDTLTDGNATPNLTLTSRDGKTWQTRSGTARVAAPPVNGRKIPQRILAAVALRDGDHLARFISTGNGEWLYVRPREGTGYGPQPSGIYVIQPSGRKRFYSVPIPTPSLYKKLRDPDSDVELPAADEEGGIHNSIGPFAFDGEKLWFANSFYDGEGRTGVGALGCFDVKSRKYEMRYLPEIAPWSGSLLRVQGKDIWVGLMGQPEGAPYGGGVLRYDRQTEKTAIYPVKDLITTAERLGNVLYLGTDHGVYALDSVNLSLQQIRVEPARNGPREVVTRLVPLN